MFPDYLFLMTMILITIVKGVTTMEANETMLFCLWSILIIFTKLFPQLWIKNFKNAWTKRMEIIPRKINVSLFSAKRKLAEKNEWNLSNQSDKVTHASIYLTNCRESFFFQLPSIYLFSVTLFKVWFYDNQFTKIKFNLPKILEAT